MQQYEYKVVPAPVRGEKAKGIKSTDARFAYALTRLMNSMAADGWEYLRAETLPCEERTGFTRSLTVTQQNLLIFRRVLEQEDAPYAEADILSEPPPGALGVAENGPQPTPALRPITAVDPTPVPAFQRDASLRATPHDDPAPRRIVPLGAPGDSRDTSRS